MKNKDVVAYSILPLVFFVFFVISAIANLIFFNMSLFYLSIILYLLLFYTSRRLRCKMHDRNMINKKNERTNLKGIFLFFIYLLVLYFVSSDFREVISL
jgi:Ca2+/Na+ antiporter